MLHQFIQRIHRPSYMTLLAWSLTLVLPNLLTGQTSNQERPIESEFQWPSPFATDNRPLVIILPGILGEQAWDRNIKSGILRTDFSGEIVIFDWTQGPLMLASNLGGSEQQVEFLVNQLINFKRIHPSRPLYLVGHSGGCRMIIKVLEKLPETDFAQRAILLSPCLESNYDLSSALKNTEFGLASFYSPLDAAISVPLATIQGLSQNQLGVPASTIGFAPPKSLTAADQQLYRKRLRQTKFQRQMFRSGNPGGHFGWTNPRFVADYVAPLLAEPATVGR